MAITSSGTISIDNIKSEFAPSSVTAISLNELYRGGDYVLNITANNSIPTSGSISFDDFYSGTQGFSLSNTVRTYDFAYCGSTGSRVGSDGVSTADSIYNYVYWRSDGPSPSNGRQYMGGTLTSGKKYAYVLLTSGQQDGGTRALYSGGTVSSTRGHDGAQSESTMGSTTWTNIKNNTGFPSSTEFNRQGVISSVSFTTVTASQGSTDNAQLVVKNQTGTSDAGKGGAVVYFYPYNILKKAFQDMGISFSESA